MSEPARPRLAATVILVRDPAPADAGPCELFMVRRHGKSRFMANAHVFVGGRLDDADCGAAMAARCRGLTPTDAAMRLGVDDPAAALGLYVAAVRETFEESGVLIGETAEGTTPNPGRLRALRDALHDGAHPFADLLQAEGLFLSLSRLRYLARWITPAIEPRRFDAYFFVCLVATDEHASYDQRETTEGDWWSIEALLAANGRAEILLPPPTLCTLEALQASTAADALVARAADHPSAPVEPRALKGAPEPTLLLPDDHRYDDPASPAGREHFFRFRDGHWVRHQGDVRTDVESD